MEVDEGWLVREPTLLKALLKLRHWQKRDTFAQQWDEVAQRIDTQLIGNCPAHAQFYRWLSGKIRSMPNPDACRILEAMFPGWTVQQLFQPVHTTRDKLTVAVAAGIDDSSRHATSRSTDGAAPIEVEPGVNARTLRAESGAEGSSDLVAAYPMRGLISRPKWNDTIRGSKLHLWLYGMAELGYALDDEVPRILKDSAGVGCDIRILLLDPGYPGIAEIDSDEGSPPGTLASRILSALARYRQLSSECGEAVRLRIYTGAPSVSLVRGDDRMLVTPYLRFFVGSNSPSLELKYTCAGEIFERYARHFQKTWDLAKDYEG